MSKISDFLPGASPLHVSHTERVGVVTPLARRMVMTKYKTA